MINAHNILAYIKFLYQKKYNQAAPAQLVSQWRTVEAHNIRPELQKLYAHWGWTEDDIQKNENDFVQLSGIINETVVAQPEPIIVEKYIERPKKKRSYLLWIIPIAIALAAYGFYSDYFVQNNHEAETPQEQTAGSLLEEPIEEEPEYIEDTTAIEEVLDEIDSTDISAEPEPNLNDQQNIANIKSFIFAEDNRNFDKITSLISPNIYKYYDLNYPTKAQLRNRYEHLWSITQNNTNYISAVNKVGDRSYEVKGSYEYVGVKTQERKQQKTHVLFEMDEDNKILSIDNK